MARTTRYDSIFDRFTLSLLSRTSPLFCSLSPAVRTRERRMDKTGAQVTQKKGRKMHKSTKPLKFLLFEKRFSLHTPSYSSTSPLYTTRRRRGPCMLPEEKKKKRKIQIQQRRKNNEASGIIYKKRRRLGQLDKAAKEGTCKGGTDRAEKVIFTRFNRFLLQEDFFTEHFFIAHHAHKLQCSILFYTIRSVL